MTRHITEPGLYLDFTAADYFADPCPTPSLTQSVAKILLDRSPAHAWIAHPRLNPEWAPSDPTKYDVGNIAHRLLIGRGKELAVIEADDWRTKDAKEQRAAAQQEGRLGVLGKHWELGNEMAHEAGERLAHLPECRDAFLEECGHGEAVACCRLSDGTWLRAMIDWLSVDRLTVYDYKTTQASAAPHAIAARMADSEWPIQAAMHELILDNLYPEEAGRRRHRFVLQEDEPPYALTVSELPEAVMTIGRQKLAAAIEIWRTCMAADRWPSYATGLNYPEYPAWAVARWVERCAGEAGTVEWVEPETLTGKLLPGITLTGLRPWTPFVETKFDDRE